MKKLTKIMIVAICVALLAALTVIAISANSAIETDATLKSLYVSTGGIVNIHFVYDSFGSATQMVAEVYAPGADAAEATYTYDVEKLTDNTVSVPLAPSQMDYTVKVYAQDEAGKGAEKSYSVRAYAMAILNSDAYAEYHNSIRTLLNWGASADIFFNSKSASSINEGLFSRGTNPVDDVISIYTDTTSVVKEHTENITVDGVQAFLEPGNTSMRYYFTYAGSNKLSATVQKEGGEPVEVPIWRNPETGKYFVNVHNIGVAVFDKSYTVYVTEEGVEGTATAGIKMIEYLNRIAFNADLTAENRNVAKAMFQFYTQAMNTVTECDHSKGLHSSYDINGVEHATCSTCFANVKTYTASAEIIADASTAFTGALFPSNQNAEIVIENGEPIVRVTGVTGSFNPISWANISETAGARYLVFKYRTSGTATSAPIIQLGHSEDINNTFCNIFNPTSENGEWITLVVDVSNAKTNLFVRWYLNSADVDIAFVALTDSYDAWVETDTYFTCAAADKSERRSFKEFNKDGSCANHAVVVTTEAVEGGTQYNYVCNNCNAAMADSRIVPNTVSWFGNLGNFVCETEPESVKLVANGGEAYVSFTPSATRETGFNNPVWTTLPEGKTHGQYVAIKYRTNDASVQLQFACSFNGNNTNYVAFDSSYTAGEWRVIVFDVSGYVKVENYLMLRLWHTGNVDVAYAVMSDNLSDIQALLADDETYWLGGEEYDKNGVSQACTDHVVAASYEQKGDVIECTYVCERCGATAANSKTFPASADFWADVANVGVSPIYTNVAANMSKHVDTTTNEAYLRFDTEGTNVAVDPVGWVWTKNSNYVVFKYRVSGAGTAVLSLRNDGYGNQDISLPMGTDWQTVVINASAIPGYTTAAGGVEFAARFYLTNIQIDVAYVVLTDDYTTVNIDTDTYYYYEAGETQVSDAQILNTDGSCAVHSDLTNDGSNWICGVCEKTVAPVRTYDSNVTYHADVTTHGQTALAENNEAFARITGTTTANIFNDWTYIKNVQYIVAKYRISTHDASNYLQFAWWTTAARNIDILVPDEVADGEWVTVVIDISGMPEYNTETAQECIARFYLNGASTLDLAFFALTSDYTSLVADVDTYYTATPIEIGGCVPQAVN